jgi:hypothetical protein
MGWISVAMAAVCGALAALVVKGLLGRRGKPHWQLAAAWAVLGGALFALAHQFAIPGLQARVDASTLDASLSRNAAFAAVKKHDPATYARIMAELREGLLKHRSKESLMDGVRAEVTTLVKKRLPHASDDAANEYMRVMVQEMGELRRHGGEVCRRFLFPAPGQNLDLTRYVSANTIEAEFAALSQIVRTSTVSPQPVPQKAEVADSLRPLFEALAARYGPDLALLQNPQAPGVDPDKLCSINIDMYLVILQRPAAESGKLVRYLLGQG